MENLSPQIIRRVAKEMAELVAQTPEGIRVILNEADVTDIQAVIEGPGKIVRLLFGRAFSLLVSPLSARPIPLNSFIDHTSNVT